jgi:hypothetical protein
MFDKSGEMKLSSLGLLLILAACVMSLFVQPEPKKAAQSKMPAVYFGFAE